MQTRRRRSWVLLAGVLVVLLGFGAYALVQESSDEPPARSNVLPVVGDSISVLAATELTQALGPYHPQIHAIIGERIDQMLPTLGRVVRRNPAAAVVNLGTNDMLQAASRRNWRDSFNRMIDLVEGTPCVVLTNISTLDVSSPRLEVGNAINRAIAEAADEHSNFHLLDWNALVHGPNGATLLQRDRIHPSDPGKRVLASATRAVLDEECEFARADRERS